MSEQLHNPGDARDPEPHPEQMDPSQQRQEDGYASGVDLVTLISGEFGISQVIAAAQLRERNVEVTADDEVVVPDRNFRIPYEKAKGKTISVIGRDLHFRMKFQG